MPTATEYANMPALIAQISTTRLIEIVQKNTASALNKSATIQTVTEVLQAEIADLNTVNVVLRAEITRRGVTPP